MYAVVFDRFSSTVYSHFSRLLFFSLVFCQMHPVVHKLPELWLKNSSCLTSKIQYRRYFYFRKIFKNSNILESYLSFVASRRRYFVKKVIIFKSFFFLGWFVNIYGTQTTFTFFRKGKARSSSSKIHLNFYAIGVDMVEVKNIFKYSQKFWNAYPLLPFYEISKSKNFTAWETQ